VSGRDNTHNIHRKYARLYSSFEVRPTDRAVEAAWRLGGPRPGVDARLFEYGRNGSIPFSTRMATEADTNLNTPGVFTEAGVFVLESWIIRCSKAVDDPLRHFLGTCAVQLELQSLNATAGLTPLVDLIDRAPLVGNDETAAHVLRQHEQIRVRLHQDDTAAFIAYSRHLETQSPPILKVWLYLEGTLATRVD
jgi:hypothetical protein